MTILMYDRFTPEGDVKTALSAFAVSRPELTQ
jgi:hypothetical protein